MIKIGMLLSRFGVRPLGLVLAAEEWGRWGRHDAACKHRKSYFPGTPGEPSPGPCSALGTTAAVSRAAIPLQGISPEFGSVSPVAVSHFTSNFKIIYVNQKRRRKKILALLQMNLLLLLPE